MKWSRLRTAWYVLACLLAVCVYFYGLDGQHIPKNGDEYVYEHITRLTADSGKLLPLQSQLDNMRNTKPPLLFWQGIASGSRSLWTLRYPSVMYTLLTAAMLLMLGCKLSAGSKADKLHTGYIAALTYLAFFSTYRYGRPFLTNPPEVFWLFLPLFVLLYWRQAFESRFLIPLLFGISIGIAFLYKSFALGLPVALGLSGWYLQQRRYRVADFLKQDTPKVAITITVAVALFALWFVLDPDPQSVWKEFIVGENVGKFDPHGPGYLETLLWGGSSIWSYALAFLTNPGLLTFPVAALFFVAYRRRHQLGDEQILLWIWIAALFLSFALPSQRSGRYMLAAMPAIALLCALNWQHISRKAFVASLLFAATLIATIAYLTVRLQTELPETALYPPLFWLLIAGTGVLTLLAIAVPGFTRDGSNVVALLVLLCLAAFLRPFDGALGNYGADSIRHAQGKDVWVPCNFRAVDEGHRFLLPGAAVHGYSEDQNLTANELAARFPLFAVRMALNDSTGGCAACKPLGQRLDIRGRQSSAELKEMFFEGRVFQHLFVKEVLMESTAGNLVIPAQTPAQMCR
ncbi:MAG: glycosyl transferase family 39 [Nitrosomonadales bacterium]|nr:glycosyl transferase family 39 [Nitrosomonadales bacterium]